MYHDKIKLWSPELIEPEVCGENAVTKLCAKVTIVH